MTPVATAISGSAVVNGAAVAARGAEAGGRTGDPVGVWIFGTMLVVLGIALVVSIGRELWKDYGR